MRARVRQDLQDEDAANYAWTDDQVDGAIQRVVTEFSLDCPIEQQDEITTTADDREVDITTLANLLKIVSVEYPMDLTPAYMQRFTMWNDKLYMVDEGDGVRDARVRWHKWHTLIVASSTIPTQHDEIIVLGASGYLAASASVYAVNKLNVGGGYTSRNYKEWGKQRLDEYKRQLRALSPKSKLRSSSLYND